MKKTLLFHVHYLLMGGIEKVLLEILRSLDPDKYRIKLSIAHNMGEAEVLRPQVPDYVEVRYLIDSPILSYAKRKKFTGKITLPEKALSELFLPLIQKRVHSRELRAFIQDVDVVVDFDMTLASYHHVLAGKRKVAYCHFSLPYYHDGNRRKLDKLARRLGRFDQIVMLCDEMKEEVAQMYPELAPKLVRIYNALNLERIHRMATEPLTGYEHLQQDGYFVSVGRLQAAQKDVHTVIRAYRLAVQAYGVKEQLVIVGDGGSRPELEELARTEGVADRVHFVGFQENPYKWMAHSSLFLFGSKYEGLPTALIEALALRCTIIATACPTGVKEILMQGKAGMLVPVGDHQAMSEGIHRLTGDTAQRETYREAAATFLKQFDIRYMIGEFERLVIR